MVERALARIPRRFRKRLQNVALVVEPEPPRPGLLGLYRGRPRTVRGVEDTGSLPDMIYIFQEPIQQVCSSEEQLVRQVRKTVLHEIGHHFGMSEEDLRKLGYG